MRDVLLRFCTAWPSESRSERTLVAVSGGADSVALLRLLLASGHSRQKLWVGHFDHKLRPESAEDAQFVKSLAATLEVPFEWGQDNVREAAIMAGDGVEAAARQARYGWLRGTAERLGARYVLTGHTADDQAETILHRLLRGTGWRGLAGIRRVRDLGPAVSLVRPLLEFRHADLTEYLQSIPQTWREDATNQERQFMRNRIRLDLLPQLAEVYNPEISQLLHQLGTACQGLEEIVDQELARVYARVVSCQAPGSRYLVDAATILGNGTATENQFLLQECLARLWRMAEWPRQEMTSRHYQELAEYVLNCAAEKNSPPQQSANTQGGESQVIARQWNLCFPGGIQAQKTTAGVELRRLG
ncbi:MAG: tRNA lysidine(34) synthetase TilS [Pirellulales bacterium]|nr:tRNA lysidine(34) synthetase TilS [Pirellulales bacterium]